MVLYVCKSVVSAATAIVDEDIVAMGVELGQVTVPSAKVVDRVTVSVKESGLAGHDCQTHWSRLVTAEKRERGRGREEEDTAIEDTEFIRVWVPLDIIDWPLLVEDDKIAVTSGREIEQPLLSVV